MGGRREVIATVNLPLDITRQDEQHHDKDNQFSILFADPAMLLTVEENTGNSVDSSLPLPVCSSSRVLRSHFL